MCVNTPLFHIVKLVSIVDNELKFSTVVNALLFLIAKNPHTVSIFGNASTIVSP